VADYKSGGRRFEFCLVYQQLQGLTAQAVSPFFVLSAEKALGPHVFIFFVALCSASRGLKPSLQAFKGGFRVHLGASFFVFLWKPKESKCYAEREVD
jgi:hypothetical protein